MSGRRSALIVATYAYDDAGLARLRAPEHDAEALARVLGDPSVGAFEVETVLNRPAHEVNRAVASFFRGGRPDDLFLVHFSCHGLKDDSGELYFATQDTALDLLEATSVSSSFVDQAMHRSRAGTVLLLLDCWHRLAPLSMGTLIGDEQIQCPYHGLRYNPAGRCTHMPAQETVNPSAMVSSYPVFERHRYVWVWPGDATLADPDLIPDMHQMDDPEWAGDGLTIEAPCNYQLVLDNLMDLTHEEFVHGASLGQAELSGSDFDTRREADGSVTVERWMYDVTPPPFWAKNMRDRFPDFEGTVDRWQIIHYYAPSTICIDVGVAKAGSGAREGDRSQGVNGYVMNTITPETERSCHYFWAFMRNYRLDSQLITTQLRQGVEGVFGEDEVMLTAQQAAIDANPDHEFYSLSIDAGGMWVRRILDQMLEAEGRAGTASPATGEPSRAERWVASP